MKKLFSVRVGSVYFMYKVGINEYDDDSSTYASSNQWTFTDSIQDAEHGKKKVMKKILKDLLTQGFCAELVYFPEGNVY